MTSVTFDEIADYLRQHGLDKEHHEYPEASTLSPIGGHASARDLHPGYIAILCSRCRNPFIRARNQTQISDCGECDSPIAASGQEERV